jgi:hypothetical protein
MGCAWENTARLIGLQVCPRNALMGLKHFLVNGFQTITDGCAFEPRNALMGLRHFLAPKGAEKLSGSGKEVDDLKTAETLVNIRLRHIRAESTSLSGLEAILASVFV